MRITRSEITRSNTNNISRHFVSLVRVVSWIDLFTQNICSRKQEVDGLLHRFKNVPKRKTRCTAWISDAFGWWIRLTAPTASSTVMATLPYRSDAPKRELQSWELF